MSDIPYDELREREEIARLRYENAELKKGQQTYFDYTEKLEGIETALENRVEELEAENAKLREAITTARERLTFMEANARAVLSDAAGQRELFKIVPVVPNLKEEME